MDYNRLLTWDPEVKLRHQDLSVCLGIINGVNNKAEPPDLKEIIGKVTSKLKNSFTLDQIKTEPFTRSYRDFYWRLNIDPTKVRPASEALVRRILADKPFPRISPAVDLYNLASVETFIALSGYDYNKIAFPLNICLSRPGDVFRGIGMKEYETLKGNEIIVADKEKIICIYPYRDSELSKIVASSSKLLILGYSVPGVSKEKVRLAVVKAYENISRICGGELEFIGMF